MSYDKKKLDDRDSFRINGDDKAFINEVSEKSGIDKGAIYRVGSLKEAKKILKDIEKGK